MRPRREFIEQSKKDGQAVLRLVELHPHAHLDAPQERMQGKTGLGTYPDGMVEHDAMVGQLLDKLEELGLDENTIVMYSTDNGPRILPGPMVVPRRSAARKRPTGKAAFRVPRPIRWPGVIKPGTVINDIFAHEDMVPDVCRGRRRPRCQRSS